jgi:hypothetical protein
MPMEYHFESDIRLNEESEYKSLYSWFLQECTKEGKALGSPLVPWQWTLWFDASRIQYSQVVEVEKAVPLEEPGAESTQSAKEIISATLQPTPNSRYGRAVSFSMFGTNRTIKEFSLTIRRLDDGQKSQYGNMWGFVSYTADFDFEDETISDSLGVDISLTAQNFDAMRTLVQNGRINDELTLSLQGVSGFYAEWSPAVRTNKVKVLTGGREHEVIVPDGCNIEPPRLGALGAFRLSFNRRTSIELLPKPDETEGEMEADTSEVQALPSSPPHINDIAAEALARIQASFKQLRVVLWVIAALLAAGLAFK